MALLPMFNEKEIISSMQVLSLVSQSSIVVQFHYTLCRPRLGANPHCHTSNSQAGPYKSESQLLLPLLNTDLQILRENCHIHS